MALDAISSNATPCVYASNQHFLQNVEMTWSYTSDVGMMHLVIPFFLQIAVGDASVQVASLWEEKTQGTLGTPMARGPKSGCPWYCQQRSNQTTRQRHSGIAYSQSHPMIPLP